MLACVGTCPLCVISMEPSTDVSSQTPTEFNLVIEPTNSTISPGGRIEDRKGASKTYLRLSASPAFVSYKSELMENPPPVYFDLSIDALVCPC